MSTQLGFTLPPPDTSERDDDAPFISQPTLVSAILMALEGHGFEEVNTRQMNAIIEGANTIIAELDKPTVFAKPDMGWRAWLGTDDTGVSSTYMLSVLFHKADRDGAKWAYLGTPEFHRQRVKPDWPVPHDPGDFGRCVRLLEAVPGLRPHIAALQEAEHGPVWNQLAQEWTDLEALYAKEGPTGTCPELYKRLQEIEQKHAQ